MRRPSASAHTPWMRSHLTLFRFFLVAPLLVTAVRAQATDTWSDPQPGIRYLHRSTSEPKEIHALKVDLSHPAIFLRATQSDERGRTTTSFSDLVGAAAAINGDFYNTDGSYDPVGLAIGEGVQWTDGADSSGRSFLACSASNDCSIDLSGTAVSPDPNWWSAVGGSQVLINQGVKWTAAQDSSCGSFCTTLHPRSAAGLSADGNTLILVMVEGRQDPLFGMALSTLAELMEELGAHDALNLDGGGSSALVVDGTRVSGRPDAEPSERSVANHLAVIYDPAAATSGRLVGFVRAGDIYDTEAGILGASVELGDGQLTSTDDRGFYEFAAVDPGVVTVTAWADGFVEASDDKIVEGGITNWKSLALQIAAADAGSAVADAAVDDPDAAVADAAVDANDAAGATGNDAASPPQHDASTDTDPDAGLETGDAGLVILDVGQRDSASPGDPTAGGCACSASRPRPIASLVLLLTALAFRRRAGINMPRAWARLAKRS